MELLGFLSQRAEILGKRVKHGSNKICKSRFLKFGRGPQILAIFLKKGPKNDPFHQKMAKIWGSEQNFENLLLQIFLEPFLPIFPKFQAPTSKNLEGVPKKKTKKLWLF